MGRHREQAFGTVQVLAIALLAGIGLIAAVLAAQFRHDYRMWDLKATASAVKDARDEAATRAARSDRYLRWMRYAMWSSTVTICLAIAAVLAGAWLVAVWTTMPSR